MRKDNYTLMVENAMKSNDMKQLRPVVEKELLHYDILFILDKKKLLTNLTFQGGTALRLCYGANRLSEDLNFVGGQSFVTSNLTSIKSCIEEYIGERYGLEVTVKEPKELSTEANYKDIKVDKWQIAIITSPQKKDIPKQKIKIEIANVKAYSRTPQVLRVNYPFLPDGYSDILIQTETLDEIMADKLISFVNCQKYIRHRDIWDLRWLTQQGAKIVPNYITAKIEDYHITDYLQKLNTTIDNIEEIILSPEFSAELNRFIPADVQERTLNKVGFNNFLITETKSLLEQTKRIIQNDPVDDEYIL